MKRIHLVVKGDVQGVFFRDYVKKSAIDLVGWVKNNNDGTVEVVAEGSEEELKKFLEKCREGPSSANVADIDVKWEDATGEFAEFSTIFI